MKADADNSPLSTERHDAAATLGLADELKAVYLASHREQQADPWYSPARFWERLEELYAPIPSFELVTGRVGGRMVGYAFGTRYGRPQAVWDKAVRIYPELAVETSGLVYIFREFAVHPDYQGHGYARIIHDALLSGHPEPLAYLLVRVGNPAKAAYESWGWRVIGQDQPFPDSPVMDEMAKLMR
ncbi:GNAT family N-acetyltransferase [Nocardia vinacea]|uniref:GNAT family N-acetyltransferase n=1 Tax=Nocardia vinacea TaxID=96468 RepID=UPI00031F8566|nr:GNAT family N-acetyltransferase [Nocardia vinacea]